ncbi:MAG: DUF2071 domain-containing protein [Lentisphaeraceae bacterium]|nr:DUF2071 domain-containing protein [Lentisphaeraceae bacterium]
MNFSDMRDNIQKQILINYRINPDALNSFLPESLQPYILKKWAHVGICLLSSKSINIEWLPHWIHNNSWNVAHYFIVSKDGNPACYIPRNDTSSYLNLLTGTRIFAGSTKMAEIEVSDDQHQLNIQVKSKDKKISIDYHGIRCQNLPSSSVFTNLREATEFFNHEKCQYSHKLKSYSSKGPSTTDQDWSVSALSTSTCFSTLFENIFPAGSYEFDHAICMENTRTDWLQETNMQNADCY